MTPRPRLQPQSKNTYPRAVKYPKIDLSGLPEEPTVIDQRVIDAATEAAKEAMIRRDMMAAQLRADKRLVG